MKGQDWSSKLCKLFGLLYIGFNGVIIVVLGGMLVYTTGGNLQFSPPWIFLIFPAMGILSGYWIRNLRFEWWRSLVIALSLLCSAAFLFVTLVLGPQMEKIEQEKFMMWQGAKLKNVQQMFDGVYAEDITIIKMQLDNGVDVNAVNETQQTALHVTQNVDIARLLIERGGNIHAKDDAGMTPIFSKEIEIATMLLDAGADINARSKKGNTPFVWYIYSGYLDGLRFLVSRGADANTCNVDNQNPLDIAEYFHPNTDVLKYLQTLSIQNCKE